MLVLKTVASGTSVGFALQQRDGDVWQPLTFNSNKINSAQQKYSPYNRELLAVRRASCVLYPRRRTRAGAACGKRGYLPSHLVHAVSQYTDVGGR